MNREGERKGRREGEKEKVKDPETITANSYLKGTQPKKIYRRAKTIRVIGPRHCTEI